jgi:hypothetical protein
VICLSGVCVSPLWPSETGFCPPPAQPELTENWEYLPAVPVRQQAGYLPYRHGRPGGRRLRAELWSPSVYTIQLLVNVVENWDASPRPWQSPDCIPIVGAVLSL